MTVGDVISEYRKKHGISMERFAKMAGISKAYVSMLERNKTQRGDEPSPSIEVYRSIAKALGIRVDDLIRMVDGNVLIANEAEQAYAIPYADIYFAPIVGSIPAGYPSLAYEDIV